MSPKLMVMLLGSSTLIFGVVVLLLAILAWNAPLIAALGALASISSAGVLWLGTRIP